MAECPARVVPEARRHEIAGQAFAILPGLSDPCFGEPFQLKHGLPNRFVVQRHNTIILIKGYDRHALWRSNREVIKDAPISHLSLIHISEPTRQAEISYAVFC